MKPSTCKHTHGDYIKPMAYWLCGQCFTPLEGRPVKYGMKFIGAEYGPRYDIKWQAEIRNSAEGTTLSEFLRTMVKRYQRRCRGLSAEDAYNAAIEYLKFLGEDFGDTSLCWSHDAAREEADEDMQHWDADEGAGANA